MTLHGYSPTLTIPAVRKAVAESLNRRFGMDYGCLLYTSKVWRLT